MLMQPKSVLTADTKVVLGYLFAAMDQNQDAKTIHYKTIAEATGLSEEGVRGCMARAKKAGFVSWTGKGGFVRRDVGVTGLPNTFSMQWPPVLANTDDATTRVDEPAYPCSPAALPVLASPITRVGQHTNSSLSSSLSNSHIPSTAPAEEVLIEEKDSDLPIADMKERFGWSESWPVHRRIEAKRDKSRAWTAITDEAFVLLGWQARAGLGSSAQWQAISEALKSETFEHRQALIDRYLSGKLTTTDLANVLAVAGINPPKIESANEEAA